MKKIIFTIIIFLCPLLIANAQWYQQYYNVSSGLNRIKFLNRNTGWAVGSGGLVIKTTNGGSNWLIVSNPANGKFLTGLCLVDSNVIYFVGMFETIIKSTNGGLNWIVIRNGPPGQGVSHYSVFFVNENTGWIGGSGQVVLKTTNGGLNFTETPINGDIWDIYFKNSQTGIITGDGLATYKTSNGGINWYNVTIPIGFIIPRFRNISVINNQYCYLAGDDKRVFKSTNFSDSWDSVTRVPTHEIWQYSSSGFSNELTGWVGGTANYDMLFKTTNGGLNWRQENTGHLFYPWLSIFCFNDSVVWGVGGMNYVMHTTNGGQSLVSIANNSENAIKEYELYQNYPNPFNPTTKIRFEIPLSKGGQRGLYSSLKVYDILGKEITTLINEKLNPGVYEADFDGSNFASGVYFYQLRYADYVQMHKMILLK
jgi:photosystem II stability/assembly factor-like uncharacterized protein